MVERGEFVVACVVVKDAPRVGDLFFSRSAEGAAELVRALTMRLE